MTPITKVPCKTPTVESLTYEIERGNYVSFEKIYHLYKNQVYRVCLRITKCGPDAEDLTQEVFLQAQRKLHTFRGDSAFATWLYRVAFNTVMMFLRRRRVEQRSAERAKAEETPTQVRLSSSFYGPEPIRYLALKRAIASLPAGRRAVLILHDVNGLTHREVGLRLGIAASTSKMQLYHARMALRSFLEVPRQADAQNKPSASAAP